MKDLFRDFMEYVIVYPMVFGGVLVFLGKILEGSDRPAVRRRRYRRF